jgi:sulfate transport system ATP-binding protein
MPADEHANAGAVQLDGVTKHFGPVAALDRVSVSVAPGTLTALLGPSGCGKTTLLRAIAGFESIDAGRILLDGSDITRVPLRKRNIGFVFQNYALFPHLTVERNIAFSLDVRRTGRERSRARVRDLLDLVQLPGYEKRYPHELSGGQRQRVALARALAAEPLILLLDEPFAALDANVRRDLRTWLRELHDEIHMTTLLVTHDAEEAMEIADSLVLMQAGRIEQAGPPLQLYHDPVSPFALKFFGPANALADSEGVRYVRPHEICISAQPFEGAGAARVARIVELGSRRRFDLAIGPDAVVHAEINLPNAAIEAIAVGDSVFYAAIEQRTFDSQTMERNAST